MTLLLLNTTIKISVIVSAAMLATLLLRRRSAAVRHFVLAAALACAAATPFVRVVAPAWQPASRLQVIDRPLAVFDDSVSLTSSSGNRAPNSTTNRTAIIRAVGVIWMTGVALALAVLAIGLARLWWIAAYARRVDDGDWVDIARDISRAYNLRRPPLVLHSAKTPVLGTWGVTHAKVLLPSDALDWPADRIRIVLAHELAHVRRGDWIVQVAVELLCAAYWFNPLVWFAARRLRLESEHACDDAVLTMGVEGSAYASELVDLARAFRSGRQAFVPAAPIARPSSLERRVRAMLNATLNRDPITRSASIAAALVLAAVTVLVAGFGVSAQGQFATVSGSVADQKGMPLVGVTLTLSNAQTESKYEIKSDKTGHYEFVGVPAGTYTMVMQFTGFRDLKREGINLSGQTLDLNVVMQVGSLQETISIYESDVPPPIGSLESRPRTNAYNATRSLACANRPTGGCIVPPVKVRDVRPIYPSGAASGTVQIAAVIGTDGRVATVDVVGNSDGSRPDPALANAAANAVSQWEFTPTILDGEPIDVQMKVNLSFQSK